MIEAFLFILGFSSVTAVYETVKSGKTTKSDKIQKAAEKLNKKFK